MLNVLTGINDVTVNEIIQYLSDQNKNVFVIDIYRTPIERKMSEFFEKISPYHFNNNEQNINNYSLTRVSDRFNKLFPHLALGDHYFDKFGIKEPVGFDFVKKYTVQPVDNIKYIKLRLCDSNIWDKILSEILQNDIVIIKDYITDNKHIGELYKKFKQDYQLPISYLDIIKNCKYFNFYYNEEERNMYISIWANKTTTVFQPYSNIEYSFYVNLYLENQYINDIQTEHYIDNGCFCNFCIKKRKKIFFMAKNGETHFDKIVHTEVVNEEIVSINRNINTKLSEVIQNKKNRCKFKPRQFAIKIGNK